MVWWDLPTLIPPVFLSHFWVALLRLLMGCQQWQRSVENCWVFLFPMMAPGSCKRTLGWACFSTFFDLCLHGMERIIMNPIKLISRDLLFVCLLIPVLGWRDTVRYKVQLFGGDREVVEAIVHMREGQCPLVEWEGRTKRQNWHSAANEWQSLVYNVTLHWVYVTCPWENNLCFLRTQHSAYTSHF